MDILLFIAMIVAYNMSYYTTAIVCLSLLSFIYWSSLFWKDNVNPIDVLFAGIPAIIWLFVIFH